MWQCKECEYRNENIDETCAKCGAQLVVQLESAEVEASVAKTAVSEPLQPVEASIQGPTAKSAGGERVLWMLIAFAVLAIGAMAYFAYTKGKLPGIAGPAGTGQSAANSASAPIMSEQASPFVRVEELSEGLVLPRIQANKLAGYTAELEKAWIALLNKNPLEVQPGQLSPESLAELDVISGVGSDLITAYQNFEDYIAASPDPNINEAAVLMREQFSDAFVLLVGTIGEYRGHDTTAVNPAYVLADSIPQALDKFGWVDPAPLHELWVDARHAARQIELDLLYVEYYRQLAARYDALEQIHNEFNGALNQIPPTKVRSGVIGKDAQDLLVALDTYADSVELFALEFEEYCETLEGLEYSDKLDRYIAMNRNLAQEDHLFCFTESYKMYAKDKKLVHPVYEKLGAHFSFVQETWPKLASAYEMTYKNYEQEWLVFWRPDVLVGK